MEQQDPARSSGDAAPNTTPSGLGRNVRVLGLTSLVNDIASEMIYPLIPAFLTDVLGASKTTLGAIEGTAESTASILKLFAGSLSDRVGKRKLFVVVGYAVAAVVRPLIGLATMPWQILVIRGGDRFGKGIRTAPRDAMIADSSRPQNRGLAFGFTRAMDHLGAAIGPLVAFAFLWAWPDQLRGLFLLAAIPGLVVVLLVWFGLREPRLATPAGRAFHLTLAPFDRRFRLYLVAILIFTLGNSSDAFLLVRVRELGVANAMLPLVWCAFHVVKSSGSIAAGWAVDRLGPRPLLVVGWLVYAAIYLAFSAATTPLEGWTFFLAYGAFYALTEPAERTFVADLVGAEHKGLAYGWFNFAIGVAAFPASLIFGALYELYGGSVAFGWSAVLAVVATLLLAGVRKTRSTETVA
jgi:MFS family permease